MKQENYFWLKEEREGGGGMLCQFRCDYPKGMLGDAADIRQGNTI